MANSDWMVGAKRQIKIVLDVVGDDILDPKKCRHLHFPFKAACHAIKLSKSEKLFKAAMVVLRARLTAVQTAKCIAAWTQTRRLDVAEQSESPIPVLVTEVEDVLRAAMARDGSF